MAVNTENVNQGADTQPEDQPEVLDLGSAQATGEIQLLDGYPYDPELKRQFIDEARKIRVIAHDPDGLPFIELNPNALPIRVPTGVLVEVPELHVGVLRDSLADSREAENRRRRMIEMGQVRDPRKMQTLNEVKRQNGK